MACEAYKKALNTLQEQPRCWLITGVAGFIGSNLLETLLRYNQYVIGLDNFSTGFQSNLDDVQRQVEASQWARFKFVKGDICDLSTCESVLSARSFGGETQAVDYVLHQAALGSVPRSIADPIATNQANITGFLNVLVAAKNAGVTSFTYAASSSTYGDHPALPKVEENIGNPLSPYAVTKYVNELYASVFSKTYGFSAIGLRYFNVFGKRQNPDGAYAAVIPKWVGAMIANEDVGINGDGETSRDFCFVENAVQANILAALNPPEQAEVFNVAVGGRTSLNQLFALIADELAKNRISYEKPASYRDFRAGDVRHSQASIEKIYYAIGYEPSHDIQEGLSAAMPWYVATLG